MRMLTILVVCGFVLGCGGCDPATQKAFLEEANRDAYVELIGPTVVTSIIGMSAAPCGPIALNAFCTDQTWRMLVSRNAPDFKYVPSMFEMPDPNRPVKITNNIDGTKQLNIREGFNGPLPYSVNDGKHDSSRTTQPEE